MAALLAVQGLQFANDCDPCSVQLAVQSLRCWLLSLEACGGFIGQHPLAAFVKVSAGK